MMGLYDVDRSESGINLLIYNLGKKTKIANLLKY